MRDYEYSDLYFDAHLDKQMRIEVLGAGITIDNSMIELDAFELDEMLCSEQELIFGSCEANCVKFTARDMPGSIVGKTIRITETVDGNTDVPFSYGIYKVYSDVPSSDRTKREITAYDAMYDIVNADVKSWYADLPFPMTLRQFRDSFFAHFGITQKETTLVNDGMIVNKTLVVTQTDPDSTITEEPAISGKTVIEAICEINGVFGNINRDGLFEYVELKEIISPLYPANDLYPSDDLFPRDPNTISMTGRYITFDYEDFQTKQITQLEIRPSDDSAGATVGTGGNNYVISGNFLVSDKTGTELEAIAANTLSIIRKASYTPLKSSEIVGNPCIELGDPIRFNTTREIIESYVLQRTLTGIQNKRDSIVSPGTETYKQNPNSIRDQIAGVQRRTNKLERTADHTLSELADLDANTTSRFEQTSEQIQTEVSNRQSADSDLSSRITQTADSITTEVANRQSADNEMSSRITQTAEQIQSEVVRATGAESELSSAVAQTAESIETEVINRQSADSEMSSRISQTANEIASEVTARQNADTEMSAKISQNAQAIEAEVTARGSADNDIYGQLALKIANTDDGTIISLINGSADKIHFNANNMFTVDATNITIDENGQVEIGGNFIADTAVYLCYNYASLPGINYATKVNVMDIAGGSYSIYGISSGSMFAETYSTSGMINPILTIGKGASVIKTDAQLQPDSIYSEMGLFKDIILDWTRGDNGGRVYKCCGSQGNNGIPSAEWVKDYVTANMPNTSNFAAKNHTHNDYATKDSSGYVSKAYYASTAGGVSSGGLNGYSGRLTFSDTTSGSTGQLYYKTYNGAYVITPSSSSRKIKHDIKDVCNADLDPRKLYDLRVVQFKFNNLESSDPLYEKDVIGLIAEEVAETYPLGAEYDENGNPTSWWDRYLIPPMLYLIQEQHKDIELLKQENLALQNRVSILEQRMEEMWNVINNKINQS